MYRKYTKKRQWLYLLGSIVVGSLLGFSWYMYVRLEDPVFFLEVAQKEAGHWTSHNVRPFYYYWSFFTQSGIWAIPSLIGLAYPWLKDKVSDSSDYRFVVLWTLFAVVLLSVIPEKKSRYLMPVLIPLSLSTGYLIITLLRSPNLWKTTPHRILIILTFFVPSLLIFLTAITGCYMIFAEIETHHAYLVVLFMATGTLGAMTLVCAVRKQYRKSFMSLIASVGMLFIAGKAFFSAYKTTYPLQDLQSLSLDPHIPIYFLEFEDIHIVEVIWEAGKKITIVPSAKELIKDDKVYLLVCTDCKAAVGNNFLQFTTTEIGHYNYNYVEESRRGYKKRKAGWVFLLERK